MLDTQTSGEISNSSRNTGIDKFLGSERNPRIVLLYVLFLVTFVVRTVTPCSNDSYTTGARTWVRE